MKTRRSLEEVLHIARGLHPVTLMTSCVCMFHNDLSKWSENTRQPSCFTAMSDGLFPVGVSIDSSHSPWRVKCDMVVPAPHVQNVLSCRQNLIVLQNTLFPGLFRFISSMINCGHSVVGACISMLTLISVL